MTRPPALGPRPLSFQCSGCGWRTASLREWFAHWMLYHAWRKGKR